MEEIHQPSDYGYYSPKVDPPHQQVIATNNSSSLHRNVTAHKIKRKKESYAEVVKDKISERKGDKEKTLAIEYNKMMRNRKT